MSTRRRASAGASSDGGLPTYRYAGSERDKDPDAREHDHGELDYHEYFEVLEDNGFAEQNGNEHGKALGVKSGTAQWFRIYVLHLLFMWNLRTYEYASVSSNPQTPVKAHH